MAKKKKTTRMSGRERRRKRRVRNQILAYVTLVVFILGVAAGIFFAGRFVTRWISDKRHEKQLQEEMEEMSQTGQTEPETEEAETDAAYTDDDLMADMVEASIAGMPIEDRVAGLFLTTPEALTDVDNAVRAGDSTKAALAQYPVGGLVYKGSNIQDADQFQKMLTDTISASKCQLFLILENGAESLPEDPSVYGINMEFADQGNGTFRTVTLPSLLGGRTEEGLVTALIEGEEALLADACLEAWQNGAHLLYVKNGVKAAYEGMLERIQGDAELEAQVEESLTAIYRVKCGSTLEG